MISCTFIGHRQVFDSGMEQAVYSAIERLIANESSCVFYVGRAGEYDKICRQAIHRIKQTYHERIIRSILVEPYMRQSLNTNRSALEALFDEIIIPDELTEVHYKRAITERNRWMIDRSQYLIAYVHRDFGGAWTAMNYAIKRGLTVYNLAKLRS